MDSSDIVLNTIYYNDGLSFLKNVIQIFIWVHDHFNVYIMFCSIWVA